MARKPKNSRQAELEGQSTLEAEQVDPLELRGDLDVLRGRYANHIQVSIQPEEFVLDFFARAGGQVAHLSRVFVTPEHAERLADLLKRQIRVHREHVADTPPKKRKRARRT